MGVVVPVGEYTATIVYSCSSILKRPTVSFGFTTTALGTPSTHADQIYNSFISPAVGNGPGDEDYIIQGWRFEGVSVALQEMSGPLVGEHMDQVTGADTSGSAMPPQCAILLNKATILGGRKNRGRCYLPPLYPTESVVDQGGTINVTYLAQLQDLWSAFFDDLVANDIVPVVHHSDGSAGTEITGWTVGGTIATQRRRLR